MILMPLLFGAGIRVTKLFTASWPAGLPSADNLALKSDGTAGGIQATGTSVSATDVWTLPVGGAMLSADTGQVPTFQVNNTNTGIGAGTSGTLGLYVDGTQVVRCFTNTFEPLTNGGTFLGRTGFSWDDTYTDDLYLQRTTATEGIIHGQGVSSDDELRLQIVNTSGQYDRWGFKFAPNPGAVASVTGMEITSNGAVLPDDKYMLSLDTDAGSIPYQLGNDAGTGIGFVNGGVGIYDGTALVAYGVSTAFLPGGNGNRALGDAAVSWDDFYVDDIYHQQTTGGEGREFWQAAESDQGIELRLIQADGSDATSAANAVGLAWVFAPEPKAAASVKAIAVTSSGIRIVQDGGKIEFGGTTDFLSYDATTHQIRFNGSATSFVDLDAIQVRADTLKCNTSVAADAEGGATLGTVGLSFSDAFIGSTGFLTYEAPTILTEASDAVTVTQTRHIIAAQSGTADDLATMGAHVAGRRITIQADTGDTITVVETGDIIVPGATIVLDGFDRATFESDGAKWVLLSFSDNS